MRAAVHFVHGHEREHGDVGDGGRERQAVRLKHDGVQTILSERAHSVYGERWALGVETAGNASSMQQSDGPGSACSSRKHARQSVYCFLPKVVDTSCSPWLRRGTTRRQTSNQTDLTHLSYLTAQRTDGANQGGTLRMDARILAMYSPVHVQYVVGDHVGETVRALVSREQNQSREARSEACVGADAHAGKAITTQNRRGFGRRVDTHSSHSEIATASSRSALTHSTSSGWAPALSTDRRKVSPTESRS